MKRSGFSAAKIVAATKTYVIDLGFLLIYYFALCLYVVNAEESLASSKQGLTFNFLIIYLFFFMMCFLCQRITYYQSLILQCNKLRVERA